MDQIFDLFPGSRKDQEFTFLLTCIGIFYILSAAFFRFAILKKIGDREMTIFLWLLSPVVPIAAIAVFVVPIILWPLTFGLVQPPWRWDKSNLFTDVS